MHLSPCYKKFTGFIATSQKRSAEESKVTGRLKRIRTPTDGSSSTVGLFTKECFVWKKWRKTVKTKTDIPYKITTINAEIKIKEAAEMKNDHELLGQIQDVDLVAKELMMHKQCYLENTRCLRSKTKDTAQEDIQETQGDFEKVKEFISDTILECNKVVSMTALHRLYGTGYGKENEKVYRNKLKARIVKEFEESLKVLKIDCKTPEVVVSSIGLESTSIVKSKESVLKLAAEYLRDDILDYTSKVDQSIWPPTCDSLQNSERDFPSTLNEFLRCVLKTRDHE